MERHSACVTCDAPSILVAAGRFFHVESLPPLELVDSAQLRQAAELAVEESAPLPLEQLMFGITASRNRTSVWVAAKKRLIAELPMGHEQVPHLLAEPSLPLPQPESKDFSGWRWISATSGSLTAVRVETGVSEPIAVRGFLAKGSGDLISLKAHFSKALPGNHEPGIWILRSVEISPKTIAKLNWYRRLEGAEEPPASSTSLSAAALDLADLRPHSQVSQIRKECRAKARVKKASRILIYSAASILAFQCIIWSLNAFAQWHFIKLAESRGAADKAEADSALLATLDRVTAKRLPALERLAALNRTRPEGAHLTSCAFSDSIVRITGRAASMNLLNGWIGLLRKDAAFLAVETVKIHATNDGVRFELKLTGSVGGPK